MTLSRHHLVAVTGATLTSIVALSDAVLHATTGHNLLSDDEPGRIGWKVAAGVLHGLTYTALGWVLISERTRFELTNRFTRALRHILLASLAVLAVGFVLLDPAIEIFELSPGGPLAAASGWAAGVGFAGMILSCLLLGVSTLPRNPLGYGGRVLALLVPVLGVTVLLGLLASAWAHPGYAETVIYVGIALIGVRAVADRPTQSDHGPEGRDRRRRPQGLRRRSPGPTGGGGGI